MSEIDAPLNELRRYTASNVVAIYSSLAVVFTGLGATKHKRADCRLNLFTLMYAGIVNRLCFLLDCWHQSPSFEQNRGGICLCTLTEDGQCRDQNT